MRNAILTAVLLTAATAASAADNGLYLGGSVGRADVDVNEGLAQLDGDDTGFKFIVGFRPLDWLAVEANYVDFGKVESGALNAESDGVSAFVVGFLPVGPVDLFAKGGLINWDSEVKVRGGGRLFSDDGNDFAYGVGVQFRLLSLSVRAEYEKFDVDHVDDLNMLSLGLTYTFL